MAPPVAPHQLQPQIEEDERVARRLSREYHHNDDRSLLVLYLQVLSPCLLGTLLLVLLSQQLAVVATHQMQQLVIARLDVLELLFEPVQFL